MTEGTSRTPTEEQTHRVESVRQAVLTMSKLLEELGKKTQLLAERVEILEEQMKVVSYGLPRD